MSTAHDAIPSGQHVVTISTTQTLRQAMTSLLGSGLTAAPVVDATGQYVGMLDVLDLLLHLISTFLVDVEQIDLTACTDGLNVKNISGSLLAAAQAVEAEFSSKPLAHTLSEAGNNLEKLNQRAGARNPSEVIPTSAPVISVFRAFASGVSRLPVSNGASLVGVVSQLDAARVIADHPDTYLGARAAVPLKNLGLGVGAVYTVNASTPTIEALLELAMIGVMGLAVVDENGGLTSTLRASDLRVLATNDWTCLKLPLSEFFQLNPAKQPPVTVSRETSLVDCLRLFLTHKVKHVFVVDAGTKPSAVVSLTDVMRFAAAGPQ